MDSNLPEPVKKRLVKIAGKLATDRGEIIILARRYRTRDQNLADALDRLKQMIRLACRVPKPRRKTKPSVSSNEARLATKKKRGEVKKLRIGKRNPNEM